MVHDLGRPYSGFVISMIGVHAGQRIAMDYGVAQASVISGTARWEDDETALPRVLSGVIDERKALIDNNGHQQTDVPVSVEAALRDSARPIWVGQTVSEVSGKETIVRYTLRPFPAVTRIDNQLLGEDAPENDIIVKNEDGTISFVFNNAMATYSVVDVGDTDTLLQLEEAEQYEGEIPADWRDRSHLVNIPVAKQIRSHDGKMTKIEAEAIIEEWTKSDDTVQPEGQAGSETLGEDGQQPQDGIRNVNGNQADPDKGGDPAEKAKVNETSFVNDDFE